MERSNLTMFEEIDGIQSEINSSIACATICSARRSRRNRPMTRRGGGAAGVFILKLLDGVLERRYVYGWKSGFWPMQSARYTLILCY